MQKAIDKQAQRELNQAAVIIGTSESSLRKQPKSIHKAPKPIRKQIYSINVEKITTQQNEVVQATSRGRRVCRPQRFNN